MPVPLGSTASNASSSVPLDEFQHLTLDENIIQVYKTVYDKTDQLHLLARPSRDAPEDFYASPGEPHSCREHLQELLRRANFQTSFNTARVETFRQEIVSLQQIQDAQQAVLSQHYTQILDWTHDGLLLQQQDGQRIHRVQIAESRLLFAQQFAHQTQQIANLWAAVAEVIRRRIDALLYDVQD